MVTVCRHMYSACAAQHHTARTCVINMTVSTHCINQLLKYIKQYEHNVCRYCEHVTAIISRIIDSTVAEPGGPAQLTSQTNNGHDAECFPLCHYSQQHTSVTLLTLLLFDRLCERSHGHFSPKFPTNF